MKIDGREITGVNTVTLVLPRENDQDIVFVAKAIQNMSDVDKFLEAPLPPEVLGKGGVRTRNYADKSYQVSQIAYETKRMAWMILTSLSDNDIEWDTVVMEDPNTWTNYVQEMKDAGFSDMEMGHLSQAVVRANALDEAKLEAAREVFLHGQVKAERRSSGQSS